MAEKQSSNPPASEGSRNLQVDLNFRATELRLGPPGSEDLYGEKAGGSPLGFPKNLVSGAKRGFSDVKSEKWVLAGNGDLRTPRLNGSSMAQETKAQNHNSSAAVHASKAQVVGWPPIRSFRKNSMATTNPPKTHNKSESGDLYVKVSMDNAPYLRKVDLNTYRSYAELFSSLEKMFSCFTIKSRLKDVQDSEQCVITYEDRDGDWMLVGDVPWDMFTNTCRRLRITKSTEAIGLAPQAKGKCKNEA